MRVRVCVVWDVCDDDGGVWSCVCNVRSAYCVREPTHLPTCVPVDMSHPSPLSCLLVSVHDYQLGNTRTIGTDGFIARTHARTHARTQTQTHTYLFHLRFTPSLDLSWKRTTRQFHDDPLLLSPERCVVVSDGSLPR